MNGFKFNIEPSGNKSEGFVCFPEELDEYGHKVDQRKKILFFSTQTQPYRDIVGAYVHSSSSLYTLLFKPEEKKVYVGEYREVEKKTYNKFEGLVSSYDLDKVNGYMLENQLIERLHQDTICEISSGGLVDIVRKAIVQINPNSQNESKFIINSNNNSAEPQNQIGIKDIWTNVFNWIRK